MAKSYKAVVFDADHTLLNYIEDEKGAFARLYAYLGMPFDESLWQASRRHSEETWTEWGMYDVANPVMQARYHQVYRAHLEGVFTKIFAEFPCPNGGVSAKRAGEIFLENLGLGGVLIDGAESLLQALRGKYPVYIATNGLSIVQRGRLQSLAPYFEKAYISEEVGAIKPLPAFFERIFEETGLRADEILMVGDSLSSDIAGANGVGMDGCWYNPRGEENRTSVQPKYEIQTLQALTEILL